MTLLTSLTSRSTNALSLATSSFKARTSCMAPLGYGGWTGREGGFTTPRGRVAGPPPGFTYQRAGRNIPVPGGENGRAGPAGSARLAAGLGERVLEVFDRVLSGRERRRARDEP